MHISVHMVESAEVTRIIDGRGQVIALAQVTIACSLDIWCCYMYALTFVKSLENVIIPTVCTCDALNSFSLYAYIVHVHNYSD